MSHIAEQFRSPAVHGAVLSVMGAEIGQDLRDYYPEIAFIDDASPLAKALRRLSEVLDGPKTHSDQQFAADLVAVVPNLRRYAQSLTRNATESEDLVQFTLLKAWEHRTSYRPGTGMKAWLFTILRNGHLNGRMKYRREVPDPEGMHAAGLSTLADQEHRLDVHDVREALDRLDPAQREALLLVAVEELTYEAAAERIGCPPGTVKSRVSRARDRLAAVLGEA
ncbi:sigma-70 family RNA polymerase sigma factor [Methylobacterium komagatae]|uniref:RNA polymerase sigma factor n=1 Tax=Methylobacterium komagatae TaxID=374425 RepID=A0ABW2BI07_9HYPH